MTPAGALAFAFGAGLATFTAPCVFPLLPGYVGYYADQYGDRRPVRQGSVAAAGVLAVFTMLAASVYAVDSRVLASVGGLEPLAGGVLVVLGGTTLAGRAPAIRVALPRRRDTGLGLFLFGAVYAVAAAGCTVPVLLAVVAQALSLPPLSAVAVVGAYAVGVALPLVGATVSAGYGYDLLSRASGSAETLSRVAGGLMIVAGGVQLWAGLSVTG